MEAFAQLSRADAEEFFLTLNAPDQAELLSSITPQEKRSWVRLLAPDDAVDLIQSFDDEDEREKILRLFDTRTRREITALMAYEEDDAGGLMNPQFVRLRPDMQVDEAILYLRAQAKEHAETI